MCYFYNFGYSALGTRGVEVTNYSYSKYCNASHSNSRNARVFGYFSLNINFLAIGKCVSTKMGELLKAQIKSER